VSDVLLLNQYFPPDPAATAAHAEAIAARLVREGHSVTALVGQPSYASGLDRVPERESVEGIEVRRVEVVPRPGRESRSARIAGYMRYLGAARSRARSWRGDLVLAFHNPPPLGLVAASIARRAGARFIHVVQDIHPDIVLATGWMPLPPPVPQVWDIANRRVMRAADRVVVLGEGMRRTLIEKGAPADSVEAIPLWAEPELEARPRDDRWRHERGISADLLVLIAGNMGIMHPLGPVLDAADALSDGSVQFVIAGGGVRREHWQGQVDERGLTERVHFLPFQRGEDFARMVAAADLALVPLSDGMERLAVPSRSFTFLSGGRAVIALMAADADVARIVVSNQAGWRVGDGPELAALLERLSGDENAVARAGAQARDCFEREFSREAVTGRYADLVDAAISG
jgi:colanic acid biosynthesis glycosyl transferase WcaI